LCGISGAFLKSGKRTDKQLTEIRNIVERLVVETAIRGNDATGISVMNGKKWRVLKMSVSADEFVKTAGFRNVISKIDDSTKVVLSHNRLKTQGCQTNHLNNHPISVGSVVGIHNGMITNDEEVFTKHKMKRKGEVDSEAIFALMNKFGNKRGGIKKAFKELDGTMGVAFYDKRKPYKAYLATSSAYASPCNFTYIKSLRAYFFSSCIPYLDASLIGHTYKTYSIPFETCFEFDLNGGKNRCFKFKTKPYVWKKPIYTPYVPEYGAVLYRYDAPRYEEKEAWKDLFPAGQVGLRERKRHADMDSELCQMMDMFFGKRERYSMVYADKKYLFICFDTLKLGYAFFKDGGRVWYVLKRKHMDNDALMARIVDEVLDKNDISIFEIEENVKNYNNLYQKYNKEGEDDKEENWELGNYTNRDDFTE